MRPVNSGTSSLYVIRDAFFTITSTVCLPLSRRAGPPLRGGTGRKFLRKITADPPFPFRSGLLVPTFLAGIPLFFPFFCWHPLAFFSSFPPRRAEAWLELPCPPLHNRLWSGGPGCPDFPFTDPVEETVSRIAPKPPPPATAA